jgi:hypothetical protein
MSHEVVGKSLYTDIPKIERLWCVMHKHVTHNKYYATCTDFADATLGFLRERIPRKWATFRDTVSDNFRVIIPGEFWVMR